MLLWSGIVETHRADTFATYATSWFGYVQLGSCRRFSRVATSTQRWQQGWQLSLVNFAMHCKRCTGYGIPLAYVESAATCLCELVNLVAFV
jgi:hypothetical protein